MAVDDITLRKGSCTEEHNLRRLWLKEWWRADKKDNERKNHPKEKRLCCDTSLFCSDPYFVLLIPHPYCEWCQKLCIQFSVTGGFSYSSVHEQEELSRIFLAALSSRLTPQFQFSELCMYWCIMEMYCISYWLWQPPATPGRFIHFSKYKSVPLLCIFVLSKYCKHSLYVLIHLLVTHTTTNAVPVYDKEQY